MANSETDFRQELRDDSKSYDFPTNLRPNDPQGDVGKPDLYVKLFDFEAQWWELKFARHARCGKGKGATLSEAQAAWMRAERHAGGIAAWLCCKKLSPMEWALYIGVECKLFLDPKHLYFTRRRGGSWPILDIAEHIYQLHHGRNP